MQGPVGLTVPSAVQPVSLNEIVCLRPRSMPFMPKVEVLADLFHDHATEEQRRLYTPIKTALTSAQLDAMAARIQQGREALVNPKDYLRSE